MFKRSQKNIENQIPADLFATIHAQQARRKRWVMEILLSMVIVAGLLAGGMLLYKNLHKSSEPHTVPKSNAERVTQSPQADSAEDSTGEPAATAGSGSTNDGTVPRPE